MHGWFLGCAFTVVTTLSWFSVPIFAQDDDRRINNRFSLNANAGADVVVIEKENKLKAVSHTVWVCLKAMTTEKPIKEK